jgi:tRNA(Ile)-lysidine synthase
MRTLIPVLVTGMDQLKPKGSPAPKDLGALDSCDKHRNEGGIVAASM